MLTFKLPHKIFSATIALVVVLGIALHDTKLDNLTKLAIALPAVLASYEGTSLLHMMRGESHTHVERVSVGHTAAGRMTSMLPKLQVRKNEFSQYKMQKNVPKGHHPFDNYNLPAVS